MGSCEWKVEKSVEEKRYRPLIPFPVLQQEFNDVVTCICKGWEIYHSWVGLCSASILLLGKGGE